MVDYLLEYRQLNKLKSTYVDGLLALMDPQTGRVYTSFNQTVASSGRLSSSNPNLQNIPVRTELGVRFAMLLSPILAMYCLLPIIRSLSYASWPISHTSRAWSMPLARARIFTQSQPRHFSVCQSSRSRKISAAWQKRSCTLCFMVSQRMDWRM